MPVKASLLLPKCMVSIFLSLPLPTRTQLGEPCFDKKADWKVDWAEEKNRKFVSFGFEISNLAVVWSRQLAIPAIWRLWRLPGKSASWACCRKKSPVDSKSDDFRRCQPPENCDLCRRRRCRFDPLICRRRLNRLLLLLLLLLLLRPPRPVFPLC